MLHSFFEISPGKKLAGKYTVVCAHRQGGLSTAFEVTDDKDSTRCEIQIFPSNLFKSEDQAVDFRERMMPWREIDSDAVCRVREVIELHESTMGMVTEYPEGESLRTRLNREGRLDLVEVIAVGHQLLDGLSKVHAKELVHGDIKPYTVHLQGEGSDVRVLLVDGGVTSSLWTAKGLGETTVLLGTPYYAPVEVFGGDAPDVRSDIYNTATVLYECVTGTLPWHGKSFLEVFQAKLTDPPKMSTRAPDIEVDPRLESVILRGCLADRNKRYKSAAEFRDAMAALI